MVDMFVRKPLTFWAGVIPCVLFVACVQPELLFEVVVNMWNGFETWLLPLLLLATYTFVHMSIEVFSIESWVESNPGYLCSLNYGNSCLN